MMDNNMKRTARRCAVLLALLAPLSGCSELKMLFTPRSQLWLAYPGLDENLHYNGLDLDPVRTITVSGGGGTYNVLKWWDTEVLEYPCHRVGEDDALSHYSRWPLAPDVELSTDEIVEIYTLSACSDAAVNTCAWIILDPHASFRLVGRLIWYGGRYRGPVLYVQCMTGEEFRAYALRSKGEVHPGAGPAWRRYMRRLEAEEAKKHSENEQAKP